MKPICTFALFVLIALAISCGGGDGKVRVDPIIVYTSVTGNWQFVPSGTKAPMLIGGALTSRDATVSGILHVLDLGSSPGAVGCFDLATDVPFSGTIDPSNNVKLTSASVNGQVISFTLTATPDGSLMQGTYSITGGCAGGVQGTAGGMRFANASGNWSGSFKSAMTNLTHPVSGTLTQSANANADGIFPISGTLNFPNSPCFTSAQAIAPSSTELGSFAIGGILVLNLSATDTMGAPVRVLIVASLTDPASKNMTLSEYEVTGGSCDGDYGTTGSMTRP